jgi:DegV family protein with EDD domain
MTVRIVTDSTCDLPKEIIERYRIQVVPLYIQVGKLSYLDGVEISREEFYQKLAVFPKHPLTAAPSPQKFHVIYETLADEGASEILSIHIARALSAVVDAARAAALETTSSRVEVLDSRQLSLGTGFLVETAGRLAQLGCTVAEILPVLEQQIKRTHVFAALDTLEFLTRSGRMNRFMAGFGSLLQIKPILTMYDGVPGAERVRTSRRATGRILQMLQAYGHLERLAVVHSHAPECIKELMENAERLFPGMNILLEEITPVIGTHIGPGAAGFALILAPAS